MPWLCQPVQDQTSLSAIVSQVRGSWPPAHTPIHTCYALRSKHARSIWILSCIGHSVHSWVSVIEKIPHGSVCVCKECIEKRKRWKSHTEVCVLMSDGCSPEAHACDLNKAHACDLNTVTTSMQCTDSKGKTNGYPKSRKEMQVQGGRWVWRRVCKVLGTSCCCKRVHFWKTMNTVAFTWPILPAEICY